jgi:hypothetical protein
LDATQRFADQARRSARPRQDRTQWP